MTFSVRASGTPPLRYQWQRNGANIPGATAQDYTIASAVQADSGVRFRAIVSNSFGSVASNEAILTVSANRRRPARRCLSLSPAPSIVAAVLSGTRHGDRS